MILPLQGDALMGAATPRALPWARRSLAFQAVKIAERPYPSCRPLTRGFAAFPDAQRPYTSRRLLTRHEASLHGLRPLLAALPPSPTRSVLTRPKALTRADRLLTRGITALPDAKRPYTSRRLLTRRAASLPGRMPLPARSAYLSSTE